MIMAKRRNRTDDTKATKRNRPLQTRVFVPDAPPVPIAVTTPRALVEDPVFVRQQALAIDATALQIAIATERERRINEYMAKYESSIRGFGPLGKKKIGVLAEGDSWFEYPVPAS